MTPETGGGLSGFLARGLWMLYQRVPSEGEADWLILFIALALITYVLHMPHLWRSVKKDMNVLAEGLVVDESQSMKRIWVNLMAFLSLFFLLWFFHTDAGSAFLEGRHDVFGNQLTGSKGGFVSGSFLAALLLTVVLPATALKVVDFIESRPPGPQTRPFSDRRLSHLFAGGGDFVYKVGQSEKTDDRMGMIAPIALAFVIALLCLIYKKWSAASIWLMWCFMLVSLLEDVCRMVFVFILHKRTFG